jgi:hypothetical protein
MCALEHAFEYMDAGFALLEKERQSVCELLDAVQDDVWPHIKQTEEDVYLYGLSGGYRPCRG